MLDGLREVLRRGRDTHAARRHVEDELIALNGAVSHALRARDPHLLARLPDTPQWDRHEADLARGRTTRTLNLGPAYDAYRSLRRAARAAEESSGGPLAELPPAELERLWATARSTQNALQDAITRVAPLPGQVGMRGGRG